MEAVRTWPCSNSVIASCLLPTPPPLPPECGNPLPEQSCGGVPLLASMCHPISSITPVIFAAYSLKGLDPLLVPKHCTNPCFSVFFKVVPSARMFFPFLCLENSCSLLKTQFRHYLLQEASALSVTVSSSLPSLFLAIHPELPSSCMCVSLPLHPRCPAPCVFLHLLPLSWHLGKI